MKTKNPAAVELGRRSAKSRFKGMTKKQRSEAMKKVRKSSTGKEFFLSERDMARV